MLSLKASIVEGSIVRLMMIGFTIKLLENLKITYRYESSFWFNQRPILSVHFVVQSAGVTQVVAGDWKSTVRILPSTRSIVVPLVD